MASASALRCWRFYSATIGLMFLLHALSAAQGNEISSPEALGRRFVHAINSKDRQEMESLLHPKTRQCMSPGSKPYFDVIYSRRLAYNVPASYELKVTPFARGAAPAGDGISDYPVRPSHQLQIGYESTPYNSTVIVLLAVKEGGVWYELLPCPTPRAIELVQSAETQKTEAEIKARLAETRLSAQIRTEAIALAKRGQRVDAIKRIAGATDGDFSVAKRILELLLEERK